MVHGTALSGIVPAPSSIATAEVDGTKFTQKAAPVGSQRSAISNALHATAGPLHFNQLLVRHNVFGWCNPMLATLPGRFKIFLWKNLVAIRVLCIEEVAHALCCSDVVTSGADAPLATSAADVATSTTVTVATGATILR